MNSRSSSPGEDFGSQAYFLETRVLLKPRWFMEIFGTSDVHYFLGSFFMNDLSRSNSKIEKQVSSQRTTCYGCTITVVPPPPGSNGVSEVAKLAVSTWVTSETLECSFGSSWGQAVVIVLELRRSWVGSSGRLWSSGDGGHRVNSWAGRARR